MFSTKSSWCVAAARRVYRASPKSEAIAGAYRHGIASHSTAGFPYQHQIVSVDTFLYCAVESLVVLRRTSRLSEVACGWVLHD